MAESIDERRDSEVELAFSLVEGDPVVRLLRFVSLVPYSSLGVGRRAALFALVAWVPTAVRGQLGYSVELVPLFLLSLRVRPSMRRDSTSSAGTTSEMVPHGGA